MADLLIVDDDVDVIATLAELLAMEGHVVRSAADGEQGLARLSERFPDLVLLDVEMPILGGPAMSCEMILADSGREEIPVILLAGVPDLREVAARVGTPYFLEKPYSLARLLAVIQRALAEHIAPSPAPGHALCRPATDVHTAHAHAPAE